MGEINYESELEKSAHFLIGLIRQIEKQEKTRSAEAEILADIYLDAGGVERWKITIERVSSVH